MTGPRLRDGLARYRSAQPKARIRLNSNESPYPPPSEFFERLAVSAREIEANRYPDGQCGALREALARRFGPGVLVGSGSNEIIFSALLAYGGPGRRIGIFEPTYTMYSVIAQIVGAEVVSIPRDARFAITAIDEMAAAGPDVVMLCSPNNPTGNADAPGITERIASALPDSLVVVDEAYQEFAIAGVANGEAPWGDYGRDSGSGPGRSSNIVSVRTFSKAWSMAAFRVGYALGEPEILDGVASALLPYHLSALSQEAALIALDFEDEMRDRVDRIVADRELLCAEMSEFEEIAVFPSDANFILFRPPDAKSLWQGLVDRGVLIRDCTAWPGVSGCLRVTVGTADENAAFLSALSQALGRQGSV